MAKYAVFYKQEAGVNDQGWVKLHRKALNNKIWLHDPTAWRVFEYFLLIVDHKTGKRDFGRFQVARHLDINPNTLYSALKRLKSAKMITLTSNNRYSTIYILNWHSYQEPVNTSRQQLVNNRATLNKNRELRNNNVEIPVRVKAILEELGDKEFTPTQRTIDLIEKDFGKYMIMPSIKKLADYNELHNRKLTTQIIRNWLIKADKFGELETRDK
jgi:DNA-binding transcriptional regulator YhcF (GntR family)